MNPYDILFHAFAFCLGACIGSFLNVCIYRMPLGLSVNEPKRSFCPHCKYQIPWHHNLPLISWLSLRGNCGNCGAPIAFRYFGVELLTALLFLGVWHWAFERSWILALPYWIMVSLFIVATFIDFEHFIIPDEITWGGAATGIVLSALVTPMLASTGAMAQFFAGLPGLVIVIAGLWLGLTLGGPLRDMRSEKQFLLCSLGGIGLGALVNYVLGARTSASAILQATGGAAAGYFLIWGVVEAGKLAFGKKVFQPKHPAAFTWTIRTVTTEQGEEKDADLVVGDISWKSKPPKSIWRRFVDWIRSLVGRKSSEPEPGESWVWSETFYRDSDRLIMKCTTAVVDGEEFRDVKLEFQLNELAIGDRKWVLESTKSIVGTVTSLIVPREAMGFGDVKYMACIGAFLGWKAVLFTLVAASMIGAIIGVFTIVIGRREWSAKIPFGPYLSAGALIWLFWGPQIVAWYWGLTHPPI